MSRSLIFRIATLSIATLLAIHVPGLAVAHGHAHHEMGDNAAGKAINTANDSKDHAHPEIDRALSVRSDVLIFLPQTAAALVPGTIVFGGARSLLLTDAPARPGDPEAFPRQSRAPPLG